MLDFPHVYMGVFGKNFCTYTHFLHNIYLYVNSVYLYTHIFEAYIHSMHTFCTLALITAVFIYIYVSPSLSHMCIFSCLYFILPHAVFPLWQAKYEFVPLYIGMFYNGSRGRKWKLYPYIYIYIKRRVLLLCINLIHTAGTHILIEFVEHIFPTLFTWICVLCNVRIYMGKCTQYADRFLFFIKWNTSSQILYEF